MSRKKIAESSIDINEEKYRTIFENTAIAMTIVNEKNIISLTNKEFERLSGYSSLITEDNKSWLDFIFYEDLEKIQFKRQLITNKIPDIEKLQVRFKDIDGEIKDVILSKKIIPGTKESIISLLDITNSQSTSGNFNEKESKVRSIIEASSSAVVLLDHLGIVIDCNREYTSRFNLTPEELKGKCIWKLFPEKISERRKREVNTVFKTGNKFSGEDERDGFWNRYHIAPASFCQGAVKTVIVEAIDITQQKIYENKITHLNRVLHAIRNINHLITKTKEPSQLIQEACNSLVDNHSCYNAWIALLDDNNKLTFTAESGVGSKFTLLKDNLQKGIYTKCAKEIIDTKQPHCIEVPLDECPDCPLSLNYNGRSAMILPLKYEEKNYGILSVSTPQKLIGNKQEQTLFMEVAQDIAFALYRINLEKEQKKSELALRESEERFKKLSNLTFEGLVLHNNGIVKDVNESLTKLFGYKKEELIGRNAINMYVPEKYKEIIYNNIIKKNAKPYEIIVQKKDGTLFPVEIEAREVTFNGEQFRVTAIRDISERKKTEEQLRLSEQRFRQIYEHMSVGVAKISLDLRVEAANDAYCRMLEYTQKELINMHIKNITHPEVVEENLQKQKLLVEGKSEHYSMEKRFITKSGKTKYGILDANLIRDINGEPHYFLGTVVDITKRKHAEIAQQVTQKIFNASLKTNNVSEFISIIKENLDEIIDTSNFYLALFNEKSKSFNLLYHKDEKDKFTSIPLGNTLTDYVLRTKETLLATKKVKKRLVEQGEIILLGADSKVWLGIPLIIKNKAIGVMALQNYNTEEAFSENDISILETISNQLGICIEKKITEEQLHSALKKAEESDKLKSAFLANMSHEIRTPMNGILGFVNLISDPNMSMSQKEEFTTIIHQSSNRLLNTLNDIIDISKIDAGEINISKTEISINKLLNELASFYFFEANEKGISITTQPFLSSQEQKIITDSDKLHTIFANLIKNAIKYTEKGKINIGYTLKDKYIEFYVTDTGIGIPQDRIKAIFNRFEQADIEDTRAFEGSGLGLAITKAYVEILGGTIWLKSQEQNISENQEGWSKFFFTIPYKTEAKKDNSPLIRETKNTVKDGRWNILIAEDDKPSSILLKALLNGKYSKLTIAKNGLEALEICQRDRDIDLVLMDIKMPKMNGLEATRQIRKFNKELVIIALTAYAFAGDQEKALLAGCTDYITKPIKKSSLLDTIDKHMDIPKQS